MTTPIKIIERTEKRLAEMPASQGARLFGGEAENQRRTAIYRAREHVAEEGIAAVLSEWPATWPAWQGGSLYSLRESEFEALARYARLGGRFVLGVSHG